MKEKTIKGKKELAWAFYQVLGTFYGIHGPARIMNWLYDVAHGESREISELFPIRPEERAKYEWHGNDATQPAPGWISLWSERPETDRWCWTIIGKHVQEVPARLNDDQDDNPVWEWMNEGDTAPFNVVTHWQYVALPAPPEPASTSPQGARDLGCKSCGATSVDLFSPSQVKRGKYARCRKCMKFVKRHGHFPAAAQTGAKGAVPGPQEMDIRLKWDDSADVLYLCFGDTPAKQRFDDSSGDIIRYDKSNGRPSGATILCFSKRAAEDEIKLTWELATPEPHSPPATSGYVQEVLPDDAEGPSCHVCGALMVRQSREKVLELIESLAGFGTDSKEFMAQLQSIQKEYPGWDCQSCGATTGCTPAEGPRKEVGYCFATFEEFGCTLVKGHRGQHEAHGSEPLVTWPSAEPAASVDERLAEIAEPDLKELIEDFGIACVRFGSTEDGSVEESEAAAKSNKLHDDLLRLVAELRDDLKTVNEAWHADLVQWGQEQKAAKARAERAERERDRLAGPNPTP